MHFKLSQCALFKVSTLWNLTLLYCVQSHGCVEELKTHLLSQCKAEGDFQLLSEVLQSPDTTTALLINERFLNIPVDIVPLLVRSLLKEWHMCSSRSIGVCKYVVMIARSHMVLTAASGRKRKTSPSDWHKEQCVFDYQEDQFFFQVLYRVMPMMCYTLLR